MCRAFRQAKILRLNFNIKLPDGYHLNVNAPNRYEISSENENIKIENRSQKFKILPLSIPVQTLKTGETNLKAKISVFYCREDNTGECLIKTLVWQIPVKISNEKTAQTKSNLPARSSKKPRSEFNFSLPGKRADRNLKRFVNYPERFFYLKNLGKQMI